MNVQVPEGLAPELAEVYRQAAEKNVLASLNPEIFFGYFSVCADGHGHGGNTTFPGLDWGQTAEALLWLGRQQEVLASWEYVKGFLSTEGLLPFAIIPNSAGKTSTWSDDRNQYTLAVAPNGAVFKHWVPGDPLRTLANITAIILLNEIFNSTKDKNWLIQQADMLLALTGWLGRQVSTEGMVKGAGFYLERPTRLEYDGVTQCYAAHVFGIAASLFKQLDNPSAAKQCEATAARIIDCFRKNFWAGDHCVEYIHPERGSISCHGLTDVDWAAIAIGAASAEQIAVLWPQLKDNHDFLYSGMPCGIATRPETYEDWEMHYVDRHDLAAMGRVWYLECWARHRMGDREGIHRSMLKVARTGARNDWYWWERYYSEKTGELAREPMNKYCEYPANLIRIVHSFLLDK